jgi:two-component system chemotaxis sensor kinase CheA
LQRAVRDAAHSEGKLVTFVLDGSDVELDKKVLETLKDPLLHLLRNAVIHGIEIPEIRTAAGKPAEGQVGLIIRQQGSEVHIAVHDDGRGFDVEALRRNSAENGGPVFESDADPNDIIVALAFQPGITTMKQVTELAGRGVGLDVVRQGIVDLRGRIKIENMPGEGATIQLVVPVSLAMSRGLLVQVGRERYALPLISVERIVESRDTFTIGGQAALQVGDRPLPLISLASLLDRPQLEQNGKRPLAVILSVGEQRLAVRVDDVLTEQELAVKPLGKPLLHVRNVEGTAMLATGEPVVVLNAADLIKSARGAPRLRQSATQEQTDRVAPRPHILVVDDSITTRTLEKNILEAAGYRVTTAIDGLQALDKLEDDTIELMVLDVQMPHLDGFALTEQLRESAKYRSFPIVLVTSLESREDRERGMVAGADAYIVKRGFDQAELLAAIDRLLIKEQIADV